MSTKLRASGWYRAGLFIVLGIAFSYAVDIGARAALGYDPVFKGEAILTLALTVTPLFFFVGLGAFDYWFYWAAGKPTRPEDHSGHGARRWQDYFRVNTDHKVIGIQYTVTSFFFLFVGGLLAMLMRAELARPGRQFVDANTFNGLFSVHASILIFLFIIPVRAGHVLLPAAAARLGELLDVAARRDRDAVHRRVAVLRAARPRAGLQLLPRRGRGGGRRGDVPAPLF